MLSKNERMGPPLIGKANLSHRDRSPYTQPEVANEKICVSRKLVKGTSSGAPQSQPSCADGKLSYYRSNSRIEKLLGTRVTHEPSHRDMTYS